MCDFRTWTSNPGQSARHISPLMSRWQTHTETPLTTNQFTLGLPWLWHESGKPVVLPNMTIMLILFRRIRCKRRALTGRRSPFQQFAAEHLSARQFPSTRKCNTENNKTKLHNMVQRKWDLKWEAIYARFCEYLLGVGGGFACQFPSS